DLLVGLRRLRAQPVEEVDAGGGDLRARRGEVAVPHVEGGQVRAGAAAAGGPGGLEERTALAQDLVVLAADAGQPRGEEHEKVVEEAAARLGVALDELEVLRREDDAAHDAQDVAGPADRRPVETRPVRLARNDLELD